MAGGAQGGPGTKADDVAGDGGELSGGRGRVETSAGPRKSNAGKGTPRRRQVKAGSVPWMDQGALWPGCRTWGWWKMRMERRAGARTPRATAGSSLSGMGSQGVSTAGVVSAPGAREPSGHSGEDQRERAAWQRNRWDARQDRARLGPGRKTGRCDGARESGGTGTRQAKAFVG